MVGTLTNQIPASRARKVHMMRKARMVHKVRMARKAHKACAVPMAHKVVGKISGFYVNEVFHFH